MRFNRYVESPYRGFYVALSRWCNQPSIFKKKSLIDLSFTDQKSVSKKCSTRRYFDKIEEDFPDISDEFLNARWEKYRG